MSKQETQPRETERKLLDCALTLFAEKGYAGASVREIIEAAGVTRPVLYYYCENKEDLFRRVVLATHEEAYRGLAAILMTPGSAEERLRTIARGTFEFCAQDPRVPRLMFQVHFGSRPEDGGSLVADHTALRFGVIAQVMREGLETGQLRGGDAESLALVFCSLIDQHVLSLASLPEPGKRLTAELADGIVDVFLYGVGEGDRRIPRLPRFPARPQLEGENPCSSDAHGTES